MNNARVVIALDVGERRIGVAVARLEARLPKPLMTIDRQKENDIFETLNGLVKTHEAGVVVVGLPRGMEGQETAQTLLAREFAAELAKSCSAKVYLQDEAATSILAEEDLKATGKPYDKGEIDKIAAYYILRDWLASEEAKVL